jgi:hypothetical protein
MSVEAPAQIKRARKLPTWAIVAITAAVMAALFAGYLLLGDTMRWSDPAGYRACSMLADTIDADGKIDQSIENSRAIATHAQDAKSLRIRETVRNYPDLADVGMDLVADLDELHAVCVTAGVEMPAVSQRR